MYDCPIIEAGVKEMVSFGNDKLMPHFIYCGNFYQTDERGGKFKNIILKKMKELGIKSSILTMLNMERYKLVTKEKAKKAWDGKLKNERDYRSEHPWAEISINDDLEIFRTNLLKKEIKVGC